MQKIINFNRLVQAAGDYVHTLITKYTRGSILPLGGTPILPIVQTDANIVQGVYL